MMKKVLADFADDADFSERNILKFFFTQCRKGFRKVRKDFFKILNGFFVIRRNLNSKFSVIICRDSCGNRRFDEVNDKVDVNF